MTCRELISFLDQYLDGTLPAAARSAFEGHLRACRACRDYLRTYRDTLSLAKAEMDPSAEAKGAPRELIEAILAARAARMEPVKPEDDE